MNREDMDPLHYEVEQDGENSDVVINTSPDYTVNQMDKHDTHIDYNATAATPRVSRIDHITRTVKDGNIDYDADTIGEVAIGSNIARAEDAPVDYSTAAEELDDDEEHNGPAFSVGDIVDVMRRMWAGINRPGGVGRVKEVNYDEEDDEFKYSVEYVVNGGRENNIERIYLNKIPEIEDSSKRQRHTRGRCRWCVSFVKDCGHDQNVDPFMVIEEPPLPVTEEVITNTNKIPSKKRKHKAGKFLPAEVTITHNGQEDLLKRKSKKKRRKLSRLTLWRERKVFAAATGVEGGEDDKEESDVEIVFKSRMRRYKPSSSIDYAALLKLDEDNKCDKSEDASTNSSYQPSGAETPFPVPKHVNLETTSSSNVNSYYGTGTLPNSPEPLAKADHSNGNLESDVVQTETFWGKLGRSGTVILDCSNSFSDVPNSSKLSYRHGWVDGLNLQTVVHTEEQVKRDSMSYIAMRQEESNVPTVTSQHKKPRADYVVSNSSASVSCVNEQSKNTVDLRSPDRVLNLPTGPIPLTMRDLHEAILSCCVASLNKRRSGSESNSDDDAFINNSADAELDTAAAVVNDSYAECIGSLALLPLSAKLELFTITFDWMKSKIWEVDSFLTELHKRESYLQSLINNCHALEGLSPDQVEKLERIWKEHQALVDRQDEYFKQIERAGFEVIARLRGTGNATVKLKSLEASSWSVHINAAKSRLYKGIRQLEDLYFEAQLMCDSGNDSASLSNDDFYGNSSGEESESSADLAEALKEGFFRADSVGNGTDSYIGGRLRDAAKEAGRVVRRTKHNISQPRLSPADRKHRNRETHIVVDKKEGGTRLNKQGDHHVLAERPTSISTTHRNTKNVASSHLDSERISSDVRGVRLQSVNQKNAELSSFHSEASSQSHMLNAELQKGMVVEIHQYESCYSSESETEEEQLICAQWRTKNYRSPYRRRFDHITRHGRGGARVASTDGHHIAVSSSHRSFSSVCAGDRIDHELDLVYGDRRWRSYDRSAISHETVEQLPRISHGERRSPTDRKDQNARKWNNSYVKQYRRKAMAELAKNVAFHGRVVVLENALQCGGHPLLSSVHTVSQGIYIPKTAMTIEVENSGTDLLNETSNIDVTVARAVTSSTHSSRVYHPNIRRNLNIPVQVRIQSSTATSTSFPGGKDQSRIENNSSNNFTSFNCSEFPNPNQEAISLENSVIDVLLMKLVEPTEQASPLNCAGKISLNNENSTAKHWAVQYVDKLYHTQAECGMTTASEWVRALCDPMLIALNEVMHKLDLYTDLVIQHSLLQSKEFPKTMLSGYIDKPTGINRQQEVAIGKHYEYVAKSFDRQAVWTEIVHFANQKMARVRNLFPIALLKLMQLSVKGKTSELIKCDRVEIINELLSGGYEAMEKVIYSRATYERPIVYNLSSGTDGGKGNSHVSSTSCTNFVEFLRYVSPGKVADLQVYHLLKLILCKAKLLEETVLSVIDHAKSRAMIITSDTAVIAARSMLEKEDWEVMNLCFQHLLIVQEEILTALMWNEKLLLAASCLACSTDTLYEEKEDNVEPGIDGRAGYVCDVLECVTKALWTVYTKVNSARTSSSGSISGGRIWKYYDASREQVNGPIATQGKRIWTGFNNAAHNYFFGLSPSNEPTACLHSMDGVPKLVFKAKVNPMRWVQPISQIRGKVEQSMMGFDMNEQCVVGVMALHSHVLFCSMRSFTGISKSLRIDGAWDMLRLTATVTVEKLIADPSGKPESASKGIVTLLQRVAHLCMAWTDASSEGPSLFAHIFAVITPHFSTFLPLSAPSGSTVAPSSLFGSLASIPAAKSNSAIGASLAEEHEIPLLNSSNLTLLCFHAHASVNFGTSVVGACTEWVREEMHEQLLFAVSILFRSAGLSNPYFLSEKRVGAVNALDNENSCHNSIQRSPKSMDVLLQIRQAFKLMLYNSFIDPSEKVSTTSHPSQSTLNSHLFGIRTIASKVPRIFGKLPFLDILNADSSYASSMLLLLLVKEMSVFFGDDVVRNRLKMTLPNWKSESKQSNLNPAPFQQLIMQYLLQKLSKPPTLSTGQATKDTNSNVATVPPPIECSGTLSEEVEKLLKQGPLHQTGEQFDTNKTINVVDSNRLESLSLDEDLWYVAWFAAAITFLPFPIGDNAANLNTNGADVKQIADVDIKCFVEQQRADDQFLDPIVQMLRIGNEECRKDSQQRRLAKSLEMNLAICASLLKYISAVSDSTFIIALHVPDYSSEEGDNTIQRLTLRPLHASLLREICATVRLALHSSSGTGISKTKNGVDTSAGFLIGLVIQFLSTWHASACKMLMGALLATNLQESAQSMLQNYLFEQYASFSTLLREFLGVTSRAVTFNARQDRKNQQLLSHATAEIVSECKTLLTSLASFLKHQDVSTFHLSESFCNERAINVFTKKEINRQRSHTSTACAGAVCRSLGNIVHMLISMDTSVLRTMSMSATRTKSSSEINNTMEEWTLCCFSDTELNALISWIISEVLDSVLKCEHLSSGGANLLLGNWLRITFWESVLSEIDKSALSQKYMDIISHHIPAILNAWTGFALVNKASPAISRSAVQLNFFSFTRKLHSVLSNWSNDMLSQFCTNSANENHILLALTRMSSEQIQALRLTELFLSAKSFVVDYHKVCDLAEAFLRRVAADDVSNVFFSALQQNYLHPSLTASSIGVFSFPISMRESFETTNSSLMQEMIRCIKYLNLSIFQCGGDQIGKPVKAQLRSAFEGLKTLLADLCYFYRAKCPSCRGRTSIPILLRNVLQLPKMVPLDLVGTFLSDFVEPDVMDVVDGVFQRALFLQNSVCGDAGVSNNNVNQQEANNRSGKHAGGRNSFVTVGQVDTSPSAIQAREDLERAFLNSLLKYILIISDTPYSTRMVGWRKLFALVFLSSRTCSAGAQAALISMSDHSDTAQSRNNIVLTERTMDSTGYLALLLWSLAMALPIPERLAILGRYFASKDNNLLRDEFVQLTTKALKLSIRPSILHRLFAVLMEAVRNSASVPQIAQNTGESAEGGHQLPNLSELPVQDPSLARFQQYILLGSKNSSSTVGSILGTGSLGIALLNGENELWNGVQKEASALLNNCIAEEQGKISVKKSSVALASAASVMVVLPWNAVKASLLIHFAAFSEVINLMVDRHSAGVHATAVPRAASTNSSLGTRISESSGGTTAIAETAAALVTTSAVYMLRTAVALCDAAGDNEKIGMLTVMHRLKLEQIVPFTKSACSCCDAYFQRFFTSATKSSSSTVVVNNAAIMNTTEKAQFFTQWHTLCATYQSALSCTADIVKIDERPKSFSPVVALLSCGLELLQALLQSANCANAQILLKVVSRFGTKDPLVSGLNPCKCGACTNVLKHWDDHEALLDSASPTALARELGAFQAASNGVTNPESIKAVVLAIRPIIEQEI